MAYKIERMYVCYNLLGPISYWLVCMHVHTISVCLIFGWKRLGNTSWKWEKGSFSISFSYFMFVTISTYRQRYGIREMNYDTRIEMETRLISKRILNILTMHWYQLYIFLKRMWWHVISLVCSHGLRFGKESLTYHLSSASLVATKCLPYFQECWLFGRIRLKHKYI